MQALLKAAIPVDAPWTVVPIYKVIASMPADKPWIESVKELQRGKIKAVCPEGYKQDGEIMMAWTLESLNLLS